MPNITIAGSATFLNDQSRQFAPEIRAQILQGLEMESNILAPKMSDGEFYVVERAVSGQMLQPYQGGYTPTGSVTHGETSIRVRPIKMDMDWTETDLKKWWDAYLGSRFEAGRDPMTWTFPKYIYDKVLLPKISAELNSISWDGSYAAPTPGTPGAVLASVDGFKKIIADAVTATTINVVATGVFTATDIREKVEDFLDAIPTEVTNLGGKILMSMSNLRKYFRDYRGEFTQSSSGPYAQNNGVQKIFIDGYNVEIMGVMAMGSSNRWIFVPNTQADNMSFIGRQGYAMYPEIIFDHSPRVLHMYATIYRGFGFEAPQDIYVNDQV